MSDGTLALGPVSILSALFAPDTHPKLISSITVLKPLVDRRQLEGWQRGTRSRAYYINELEGGAQVSNQP